MGASRAEGLGVKKVRMFRGLDGLRVDGLGLKGLEGLGHRVLEDRGLESKA